MATSREWARAFARQAAADFESYIALDHDKRFPACHKLQFLQMSCEKLAKAHLCQSGVDPAQVQSSHAYVAKNLPLVIRQQMIEAGSTAARMRSAQPHMKHLAAEIELLAPAVLRGGRRLDNCEYPWIDAAGRIRIPLNWQFSPTHLSVAPGGRTFLKALREALAGLI